MDVKFENPFEFQLDILESDNHIPSLKVCVRILVEQFQHKHQYEGCFWVECAVWDSFLHALHSPSADAVSLHDLSENFAISIKNTEKGLALEWRSAKKDVGAKRQIATNFISFIDGEVLEEIRQQFDNFPTWW